MNLSCVILTRNAGPYAEAMTAALARQSLRPSEVLVFDTASGDETVGEFSKAGAIIHHVDPQEFHHGRTRNIASTKAQGDVLVFLTQDAIPANERTLELLVKPLAQGSADGAFGRHLPRADASPLERFARTRNYPSVSRITTPSDIASAGIRAYFFSNACSAIRKDVLLKLGGFPEGTVMNEDMLFAAKALQGGYRLAYVAEATAWHSHQLSPAVTFKRYFDVGTVFADAGDTLSVPGTAREGFSYFRLLLAYLVRRRKLRWIYSALLETVMKATGFWTGRRYRYLPPSVRTRLSLHPNYWSKAKTAAAD